MAHITRTLAILRALADALVASGPGKRGGTRATNAAIEGPRIIVRGGNVIARKNDGQETPFLSTLHGDSLRRAR